MKTAVEWLFDKIVEEWGLDIEERDRAILNQAREMEKQQIIDAFINGYLCHSKKGEQYYNEKFKTKSYD